MNPRLDVANNMTDNPQNYPLLNTTAVSFPIQTFLLTLLSRLFLKTS